MRAASAGTNEPICAMQRDQRHLPQIGGLARHVRPGQQHDLRVAGGDLGVVGDEWRLGLARLDDRMPPGDDVNRVALVQFGTAVVVARRRLRQRQRHVQLRQRARRPQHRLSPALGHLRPQRREQLLLQLDALLLRVEDQRLELLEVGRDVALAGRERLLADVVGWDAGKLRVGDLQIVAEDLVVADPQRGDATALALLALQVGDPLAGIARRVEVRVQLLAVA